MWGISTFFNPSRYPNKLENLKLFRSQSKKQGLNLILVELAFGDAPFEVPGDSAEVIIRLRTDSVLWHKERLINIALNYVPTQNVAWIDTDVLLANRNWVQDAEDLLEMYPVVQLYETAEWMDAGWKTIQIMDSAAARQAKVKNTALIGGHCGFGWAGRTEILKKHGFYDRNIIGGGDVVMTWAMYRYAGIWPGRNFEHIFLSEAHRAHVEEWSQKFYEDIQGNVGCVPGKIAHLWHGRLEDRSYMDRHVMLANEDYQPLTDVKIAQNGCLEWATRKPILREHIWRYFDARRENPAIT